MNEKEILAGLTRLAVHFEGLQRTLNSEGFAKVCVGSWRSILAEWKWTATQWQDAVEAAIHCHTERNITPANIRGYLQKSYEIPHIKARQIERAENAKKVTDGEERTPITADRVAKLKSAIGGIGES
jgi:hypothetical protein